MKTLMQMKYAKGSSFPPSSENEYEMEGIFSEKSDVYGFGEIVTRRRSTKFTHDENGLSLMRYAWKFWNEGEAVKLIDPSIFDPSIEMEIMTVALAHRLER